MKKLLGVLLALLMCCVPIGIQAEEEVLSFEYTGQKIGIEGTKSYHYIQNHITILMMIYIHLKLQWIAEGIKLFIQMAVTLIMK